MQLLPIKEHLEDNPDFLNNPLCKDTFQMSIDFYKKAGFRPPWICYYVEHEGALVGCAAYKGAPVNGSVEIAYGTMKAWQQKGIGTTICRLLVETALMADPTLRITARTLPEQNHSTRILRKNSFVYSRIVDDPEDGPVWEWVYQP